MAVAAGAMVLGLSSARAADIEPVAEPAFWYVSLFGGASWLRDVNTNYEYEGYAGHYQADPHTETGFIVGGALGAHVTDDLRVEVEVAYSENNVDKIHYADAVNVDNGNYDADGHFEILTFMANLWYDLPLNERLTPYIGGGAGIAIVDAKAGYSDSNASLYDPIFDGSETVFAFQLGAGLKWNLWDHVALDVGYRFRGIDGPRFESKEVDPNQETTDYDADWMWSHNFIGGISLSF
jgi:opacity protein-like surface antigen